MSTQGYVPGPCQIFVGTGGAGAYQFLGWSERGVRVTLSAAYEDIVSDFGGPRVPVDSQFMGEQATSNFVLNRYDETVLQTILKRRVGSGVTAGAIEANGLGSLMVAQGYAYKVFLYSPYYVESFYSTMVPCYVFSGSWVDDDAMIPLSVQLKRPEIRFRHIPVWNAIAASATLYTNVVPSPLPTPD
jgi:hypothetical protein